MKKWLILSCLLLGSCSSITEKQTDIVISEIKAVEKQVEVFEQKLPQECKTIVYDDLNHLKIDLKGLEKSVSQINESCEVEKDILEHDNTIKSLWIFILIAIIIILVYTSIKRSRL